MERCSNCMKEIEPQGRGWVHAESGRSYCFDDVASHDMAEPMDDGGCGCDPPRVERRK